MSSPACGRRNAAAVVLVMIGGMTALADPIIVDNGDPGFTVLSGTWATAGMPTYTDQWFSDYRQKSTSSTVTGEVEWRPTLPVAGNYQVAVWYRAGTSRPNNARYTVYHEGGSATVNVNQQTGGASWVTLGTYSFAAGTAGRVTLVDQAQNGKTIVADAVKFYLAGAEFRGFWADVFHIGFQNTDQVDQMIALALQGNYNAIVPEILAYHDTEFPSHGAFWRSSIVPQSSYVTPAFDPLGYMVQQAHANGLEVHPWLVAFRVSSNAAWPPIGNPNLPAEWLMVPQGSIGTVARVGTVYTLDPGSPDVQEYLVSIVREIATDYEVDGIHWDYIRYTQTDAGYPADLTYPKSSLKRFQTVTPYPDVPPPTGNTPWDDFRRRTITELVRRVTAELPTITSNPRQPLRHSAALVTWYPANKDFHQTRPYYETFSDWEFWADLGYLDALIPMCYFDEDGSYTATYRQWVDYSVQWAHAYGRHAYIGPGIYMNSFANSVTQLQYARTLGAQGYCTYSYNVTNDTGTTWTDWYPYVATNFYTWPAAVPSMPWRDPSTATEGTLYGRVFDAPSGLPIDDATVTISGFDSVQTDGNGYYVLTRLPAAAGGTTYTITGQESGYTDVAKPGTVYAGEVSELNIPLGGCVTAAECDDGVFCNGPETCDEAGLCRPGTPVECDDGVGCTADACDEAIDSCASVPQDALCDDGLFCNGSEACAPVLGCQPGVEPCTGSEWCNENADACVALGDGDFDGDGNVDLIDYGTFQLCFGQIATGSCAAGNLAGADGTIGLEDFELFVQAFTGP